MIHDIENVFQRRSPHILMHVKPSRVQGADAALDIIRSIACFNKEKFVDLIIIARGGGSFEDLNCFNSESLARAIANSSIPIVTAIGHETDFTIADFVSDLRAATPSVSAEIVSKPTKEILDNIKSYTNEIHYMISQQLEKYFHEYQNMKNNLKFDNLAMMIDRVLDNKRHLETMLLYTINNKISFLDRELKQHKQRMKNNDLKTILTKGFSIVFNKEGNIVSSIDNVELDDEISIKLNKGKIGAKIIEK